MPQPHTISTTLIGPFSRFKLVEFLTRFGEVEWMLEDAECPDELGMPSIVCQGTRAECETLANTLLN